MSPLAHAVVAALAGSLATLLLLRWRALLPQAALTPRSLHAAPVPRVGGLALWAGVLPVAILGAGQLWMPLPAWLGPFLLLGAVSLRDDMREVRIGLRLVAHLAAALWFAISLQAAFGLSATQTIAVALSVAWAANLYNFMDGSDGLAVAMAVAGFGAYAAVLASAGLSPTLPMAIAAAAVPVLAANWPPARLFLGDVGAVPLGFLAAALGANGVATGAWGAWFPVLVFLPFVADATVTLLRRAWRRERFWEGHRSHYYQRLHQMGAGHRGTLAAGVATMAGTCATAVACAWLRPDLGPAALILWCALLAAAFAAIDRRWQRRPAASA